MGLLKSAICFILTTRSFKYLNDCLLTGNCGKGKTLLHCVLSTVENGTFLLYMCNDSYSNQCKRKLKLLPKNDGLGESLKTCAVEE